MSGTEWGEEEVRVEQSDSATTLYSSGTTGGGVKGVESTHRNYIVMVSSLHHNKFAYSDLSRVVSLFTLPLFHVFGFFMLLKSVALAETLVLVRGRFDFEGMLRAERFRVAYVPVSTPLVVAMVKSELTERFDLRSLESVACGGAPLGRNVARRFREKFPNALLIQGYGMTETVGEAATMKELEETERYASVGRQLS